jgi:hypothetical protein
MALTLLESAKLVQDPLRKAVIETFAMESPLLQHLPFITIKGNAYQYNREGTLPSVAFRGVNESYTESTGVINPLVEPLTISGGDLDVDKFIIDTNGMEVRAVHEAMKLKAIISSWQTKFIKGDSSSDPREFDGLQRRLTGNQLISNGNGSGGTALSLAKLDEAIDAVNNPTHIIMNKALARRLAAAARSTSVGGYIIFDKDEFGRRVMFYNDLPILILAGLDGADSILTFGEASHTGTATSTSIYVVSFGESSLAGLHDKPMEVRDLGELDSKPCFRTRVEWYASFSVFSGRGAARLRYIADAAVTA